MAKLSADKKLDLLRECQTRLSKRESSRREIMASLTAGERSVHERAQALAFVGIFATARILCEQGDSKGPLTFDDLIATPPCWDFEREDRKKRELDAKTGFTKSLIRDWRKVHSDVESLDRRGLLLETHEALRCKMRDFPVRTETAIGHHVDRLATHYLNDKTILRKFGHEPAK